MPGQQIVDIVHPMSACQMRENVGEPGLWIDASQLCRLCRAPNYAERGEISEY